MAVTAARAARLASPGAEPCWVKQRPSGPASFHWPLPCISHWLAAAFRPAAASQPASVTRPALSATAHLPAPTLSSCPPACCRHTSRPSPAARACVHASSTTLVHAEDVCPAINHIWCAPSLITTRNGAAPATKHNSSTDDAPLTIMKGDAAIEPPAWLAFARKHAPNGNTHNTMHAWSGDMPTHTQQRLNSQTHAQLAWRRGTHGNAYPARPVHAHSHANTHNGMRMLSTFASTTGTCNWLHGAHNSTYPPSPPQSGTCATRWSRKLFQTCTAMQCMLSTSRMATPIAHRQRLLGR